MIGSPALRGAVSSLTCAGRSCFASTSVVSDVSVIATAATAGKFQRRIIMTDCTFANRLSVPLPRYSDFAILGERSTRDWRFSPWEKQAQQPRMTRLDSHAIILNTAEGTMELDTDAGGWGTWECDFGCGPLFSWRS